MTDIQPNIIEPDNVDDINDNISLSSFGSFDDSLQYVGEYRPSCDELPAFTIQSVSPSGQSISPIDNEPLSLLNLSISPISSLSDLSDNDEEPDDRDDNDTEPRTPARSTRARNVDRSASTSSSTDDDESDRISLDEINAQINTPPSATSQRCTSKRLNLETIFEGVFLETPPKKRKCDSWGIRSISKITVERINTYVMEQRQKNEASNDPNRLCDMFENKIDIS